VGLLPASPAATRVTEGPETDEELGAGCFFFLQILDLVGVPDDWGAPVEDGVAVEEELEEGAPCPETNVATGGPGNWYGAPESKTLGSKIPGSLSE